jgi:hypothetical protein
VAPVGAAIWRGYFLVSVDAPFRMRG